MKLNAQELLHSFAALVTSLLPKTMHAAIKLWSFNYTNFGDALTAYILDLMGQKYEVAEKITDSNLIGIGSVLQFAKDVNQEVWIWSSGAYNPVRSRWPLQANHHVISLRGTLTVASTGLSSTGISVPVGDGALALGQLKELPKPGSIDLGIVLHSSDMNSKYAKQLASSCEALLIPAVNRDTHSVVSSILKCKAILSSSLHGCVVADAFGIPNLAVRFPDSGKRSDDSWKFVDYGTAISRPLMPIPILGLWHSMDQSTIIEHCYSMPSADPKLVARASLRALGALRNALSAVR